MKTLRELRLISAIVLIALLGGASLAYAHGSGPAMSEADAPGTTGEGGYGHGGATMGHPMGPGMGPGYGMMGPGMGPGYGMMGPGMGPGYGMMGPGMGHGYGMMGPCVGYGHGKGPRHGRHRGMMGRGMGMYRDTDLTAAEVKEIMEHRLFHRGNPRLRVGKVEERDDDIIVAEIETVDGSLVNRFEIDRHTGQMWQGE